MRRPGQLLALLISLGLSVVCFCQTTATVTVNLKLRKSASASPSSAVLQTLRAGDSVSLISTTKESGFLHVIAPDGTTGWVSAKYVTLTSKGPTPPQNGPSAYQQQASISPDRIERGRPATIKISLDKNLPDLKEIRHVRVAGIVVEVHEPTTEGLLSVTLPGIDNLGVLDIAVLGKDDKQVAAGRLTYVEPTHVPSGWILFFYLALIVLLPIVCTIYDIRKSYEERMKVLGQIQPPPSVEEAKALLAAMDKGPTGFTGLTRGLVAVTLVLIVGFAIFHIVFFSPPNLPDIADKLLMLLAGTLTSIVGFYFGVKAATEAAQQPTQNGKAKTASARIDT